MDIETLQDDAPAELTHLSRPDDSVITTNARDRFDAAAHAIWPLLVARLRRGGASPEDAEDVAQESLLRAWDRGIRFADDGDLLRWCTVVARRSHIDRIRRQARLLDLRDVASDSACRDLEAVELRAVLGTVSTALARLTEQERESLQALPSDHPRDRATQVRTAVARHRARYRLRLLVGPFAALVAQAIRLVRRGAPAAVAVGALAAAVLSAQPAPHQATHGAAPGKRVIAGANPTGLAPHLPARHRPAPPAAAAATGVRQPQWVSAAPAPAPPPTTNIANLEGPSHTGAKVDEHNSASGGHLICIDGSRLGVGNRCVH
jgi:RNA polymerase sigma factor (sigma-70 family)